MGTVTTQTDIIYKWQKRTLPQRRTPEKQSRWAEINLKQRKNNLKNSQNT